MICAEVIVYLRAVAYINRRLRGCLERALLVQQETQFLLDFRLALKQVGERWFHFTSLHFFLDGEVDAYDDLFSAFYIFLRGNFSVDFVYAVFAD